MSKEKGCPDFTVPCNLGRDTMFSRMFQAIGGYPMNEGRVAEDNEYRANTRHIKVYTAPGHHGKSISQINLQGKWVEQCGFDIGDSVYVDCFKNRLVIRKDTV